MLSIDANGYSQFANNGNNNYQKLIQIIIETTHERKEQHYWTYRTWRLWFECTCYCCELKTIDKLLKLNAIATKTQTVLPLSLQNVVNFQDKQKPKLKLKPNRMLERDFSFMHIVNSIYMLYMYTFVLFARCLSWLEYKIYIYVIYVCMY